MIIKVISLWQPWASLIALDLKEIETRSWHTGYKGPLYIHAAKKVVPFEMLFGGMEQEQKESILEKICSAYGSYDNMPTGAIIAKTNLLDCFKIKENYHETAILEGGIKVIGSEYYFGDYTPGRYAWKLSNTKMIEPIPARGQQGFWNFNLPEGM